MFATKRNPTPGALVLAGLLLGACGVEPPTETSSTEGAGDAGGKADGLTPGGRDEPIAPPRKGKILTELVQPELLARLETEGYHLANLLGTRGQPRNDALVAESSFYKQLVWALEADVRALREREPSLTPRVIDGQNRVFDTGWLRSRYASFDLVGVVQRMDRRDFHGECGEVRFVYRLAYVKADQAVPTFSRMPLFFNVVYVDPSADCKQAIRKWHVDRDLSADAFVQFLRAGALDLGKLRFKQLEVNAQVVRVPSENQTDMGGQAEYFLRVYDLAGGALQLKRLENTPDVPRLRADVGLRAELAAWIRANVAAIDQGTALVPEKFLAQKVSSFTTFGSSRLANKPFSQLFEPAELRDAPLSGTSLVASPEALLFRLDDMTCNGCHQGRSVAGFHLLGAERGSRIHPLNALRVHASPHYLADQPRRSSYAYALFEGSPTRRDRPMSFEPAAGKAATLGTHCLPAEAARHFRRGWSCAGDATCTVLARNERAPIDLGVCMPRGAGFAGQPCLAGAMSDGASPRADRLSVHDLGCPSGLSCLPPEEGTPAGMCVASCAGGLGTMNGPNEICALGGGAAFDACAASGNFAACVQGAVRPAPRQACDAENPCREDYMCQRLEPLSGSVSTTPRSKGFCNPTYFIFQMRLDGHPSPG